MNVSLAKQAFEATMHLLAEVSVPMSLQEQIARPLNIAINNLAIGLNALNEPDEEQKETEVSEDGNDHAG